MDVSKKIVGAIGIVIIVVVLLSMTGAIVDQVESTIETGTAYSTYLYPQTDGSLSKSVASSGNYTVDCSGTGNKTLKLTTISLNSLNDIAKTLEANTWTFNYNATLGIADINASIYVDIYIVFSNDTIRNTIVKGAAYSEYITGDTDYHALTGTYAFNKYTIQDTSDKLRVDWMVNVDTLGAENTTLMLPESNFGLVEYTTEWDFTGSTGASSILGLVPFVWIASILIAAAVGMFSLAKS